MPERPHPRAVKIMVNKLVGWSHEVVYGAGEATYKRRALVDGKGRLVAEVLPVESVSVRARHVDGRSFFAVWLRKDGDKSWAFDDAWRTWHAREDHGMPQRLNATQAGAYAGAHDVASALAAVAELKTETRSAA